MPTPEQVQVAITLFASLGGLELLRRILGVAVELHNDVREMKGQLAIAKRAQRAMRLAQRREREQVQLLRERMAAIEGTRTPTPLHRRQRRRAYGGT